MEFLLKRNWLKASHTFISVAKMIFISPEKLFTPKIKTGEGIRVMEKGLHARATAEDEMSGHVCFLRYSKGELPRKDSSGLYN